MNYNSVVIFTTGAPGTGKTYSRCARFLYHHWLPDRKGVHWSNFPVKAEKFAEKFPDAADKIKVIPQEELNRWAKMESGPWEFFRDIDLEGAHIAIDECHNFVKRAGSNSMRNAQQWEEWLGEIRHRGCTVEFLSQDPHKVNKCIEIHAGVRISLINSEDRRDPFFKIPLGDWYELRAFVSGEYQTCIWQIEERRINGRWVMAHRERFFLTPFYFDFYDSFSRPQSGGGKAQGQEREFQKRSGPRLLAWFIRRNCGQLFSRAFVILAFIWMCFGGGLNWLIFRYLDYSNAMAGAQHAPKPKMQQISKTELANGNGEHGSMAVKAAPEPGASATTHVSETQARPMVIRPAPRPDSPGVNAPPPRVAEPGHKTEMETAEGGHNETHVEPIYVLSGVSLDWVAMGDGRVLRIGETIYDFELVRVEYRARRAEFKCRRNGKEQLVCVGAALKP